MATLTEISVVARKFLRYGLYLIIFVVIAKFALDFAIASYKKLNPPQPPKPNVAFGKLPAISFPKKEKIEISSYKLETPDGNLPTTPNQIEVYQMLSFPASIKALENAKLKARSLGFPDNGTPITDNIPSVYIFKKTNEPMSLVYNIITKVYSINYDINANPFILFGTPPSKEAAISQAVSFFSQGDGLPTDMSSRIAKTEFLKVESGKFVKALFLSEAQITKVSLFRDNFGPEKNIPVVTPRYPESNVWALIANGGKIIAAEYHYFPIDYSIKATYPLKNSLEAWNELNEGKGFIVRDVGSTDITIRRVYLAYYDAGKYENYFQPVFVFEGDDDFYAFVPAVKNEIYGKEPTNEEEENK